MKSRKIKKAPGKAQKSEQSQISGRKEKISDTEPTQHAGFRFRDVLFGLVVCLAFFFLVESALRLAGFPPQTEGGDPFVGFSGIHPLFRVENGIAHTAPEKLRYFNEASFKVPKPSGTVRVFCFGGSTTYGHPFDGRTSFPRWLQDLLNAADPQHTYEVLNAGGISYASYRILPIIEETLKYQPDLMVVYTGQNEFLERRTYSGLLDKPSGFLALGARLESFHTFRALQLLLQPFTSADRKTSPSPKLSQDSRKPVLQGEVSAILDRSAGLELYHRDDVFAKGVEEHLDHNLRAIISTCTKAGVRLILVHPASNLKDFSPFKSESSPELSAADKREIMSNAGRLEKVFESGDFQATLQPIQELIEKDRLNAKLHFLHGRALLKAKQYDAARQAFVRAKDLDVCPLRCTSVLENKILSVAKETKTVLVPFKDALDGKAAQSGDRSGIPGNESFLDHVHPTIENHQFLAEMILEEIRKNGFVKSTKTLSRDDIQVVYDKGMSSLEPEYFGLRDLNLAKTLRWAGKKEEARFALQKATEHLPDNIEIHKMLGSYYLEDGDHEKAITEYKTAVALSKEDPELMFSLAVAYYRSGKSSDAEGIYTKLINREKPLAEAYGNLAMMYLEQGRIADASALLKNALDQNPDASVLFSPYALALAMSDRVEEAVPWMIRAVDAEPGDSAALYNLAGMYAISGKTEKALDTLDRALHAGYSNWEKLSRDPVFHSVRSTPEFERILQRIR
ncbi:tetratricopeptide repeat protein [Desulfomonile tiedjei]|uniref:Tetratricopeptide repeat protein,putative transcriptional regulator n=1 Tax=Desulfomonile tiedjei (strain ATCC 49306 / DSM 6799 / DCB-1) TaxID=706587 RepID=I4C6C8_DESTA|nr:tetratricopeptide repeat protein [Desulfomonile tiedjei]AFM25119.1 tetratricopeptide repeat protein,putative transcriptional regulator [Desulfomonile tiedjei DSM 6799]